MEEKSIKTHLRVKDYSVSKEEFELLPHKDYDLLVTSPQPSLENLASYYESEDYISHTDSKRNVFEILYHQVRSIALKRKLKLINSYVSDSSKKLLDVGCGTGDFLHTAKQANWDITGIEPNPDARKIANNKTNQAVKNPEALYEMEAERFDVITLWHVLEHLPDFNEQLNIYKKLLKSSGVLIIAVPNYNSYDAAYYKAFWAAYDVPRHLWHFSQKGISQVLDNLDLQIVETKPMIFDSYYVSLLSEKYRTGKMKFWNAFQVGFKSNRLAKRTGEYSSLIYVIKKHENLK
ncbi:class I SAM-dependent methyltransferase [Bizionia sp. KMM 8389]